MKKWLQGNEISVIIEEVGEWKYKEWGTGEEVALREDEKDQEDWV